MEVSSQIVVFSSALVLAIKMTELIWTGSGLWIEGKSLEYEALCVQYKMFQLQILWILVKSSGSLDQIPASQCLSPITFGQSSRSVMLPQTEGS